MKSLTIKPLKVLIGMPTGPFVHAKHMMCMLQLYHHFMHARIEGYSSQTLVPLNVRGSILSRSRWASILEALRHEASHLFFVDSDQTFPRDALHQLLAHKVDCVAANIATKQIPATTTARYAPKGNDPGYGTPVYTDDKKGLERVWRVGTGVMLLRTDVLRRLKQPILEVRWKPEVNDYGGEDWALCEALEAAGVDIWVDHTLSRQIGHLGEFEYTHDYIGEVKREEANAA